ncbi:MAG: hypothetical protein ABI439_15045, partial [Rhodospirillales bacterium]
ELLGYLASALVLATFCMRDILALRGLAIVSNVAFMSYGVLGDLYPVLLLHILLLPINVIRFAQGITQRRAENRRRADQSVARWHPSVHYEFQRPAADHSQQPKSPQTPIASDADRLN